MDKLGFRKHVVIIEMAVWPKAYPDERWDEAEMVMDAIATQISP